MPKTPYLLSFLLLNLYFTTFGTQGIVRDAATREPLPFANIGVVGMSLGTITNAEGSYVLDVSGLSPADSVRFSFMGYQSFTIAVGQMPEILDVALHASELQMAEIQILSEPLSAEQIIKKVKEHFEENYPPINSHDQVFLHKYGRTPFGKENKIQIKSSDFVGLDKQMAQRLVENMPRDFIEYRDLLVDRYTWDAGSKVVLQKGVSMEEGSMKNFTKQMEDQLSDFLQDMENTRKDDDVYYKLRTGILAFDMDLGGSDSLWQAYNEDTMHFVMPYGELQFEFRNIFGKLENIDSKYWEFVEQSGKYTYDEPKMNVLDNQLVYQIGFRPKRGGLYTGEIYVSTTDYAVLQMDFGYAEGKTDENVKLLGIAHALKNRGGKVIFEKTWSGYHVKYAAISINELVGLERSFTVMKKQKRFLMDKTLNEFKTEVDLQLDANYYWEMVVLNRQPTDKAEYDQVKEQQIIRLDKAYAYSPEMWKNRTVIVPTEELKKYKRTSN